MYVPYGPPHPSPPLSSPPLPHVSVVGLVSTRLRSGAEQTAPQRDRHCHPADIRLSPSCHPAVIRPPPQDGRDSAYLGRAHHVRVRPLWTREPFFSRCHPLARLWMLRVLASELGRSDVATRCSCNVGTWRPSTVGPKRSRSLWSVALRIVVFVL